MANAYSNVRVIDDVVVGKAWQASKGTAATVNTYFKNAKVSLKKNQMVMRPKGTDGSPFPMNTGVRIANYKPEATLEYPLSRVAAGFIFESIFQGAAAMSSAAYTIAGTGNGQLTEFTFSGVRVGVNTDITNIGRLYISITGSAGSWTVSCYSDSGKTALVCSGTGTTAQSTTTTLTAQNNSGLSGTCKVAFTAGSTSITLDINTITYAYAGLVSKYFTTAYDDGQNQFVLTDCVSASINLSFGESDVIKVTEEIKGMGWNMTASSLTVGTIDTSYWTAQDLVITRDPEGTPTELGIESHEIKIARPIVPYPKNATTPEYFVNEGYMDISVAITALLADETFQLTEDGHALTYKDLELVYTYSTNVLTLLFKNMLWEGEPAGFDPENQTFDKVEISGVPLTSSNAVDALAITLEI